jgi:type III restriction enzyme
VGDNDFELELIAFLDRCGDITSFAKNSQSTRFRIEYRNVDGSIANYYPDFIVNQNDTDVWIIETKGREDIEDAPKWDRLVQWCGDATAADEQRAFHPLFVSQDVWNRHPPTTFASLVALCTS